MLGSIGFREGIYAPMFGVMASAPMHKCRTFTLMVRKTFAPLAILSYSAAEGRVSRLHLLLRAPNIGWQLVRVV